MRRLAVAALIFCAATTSACGSTVTGNPVADAAVVAERKAAVQKSACGDYSVAALRAADSYRAMNTANVAGSPELLRFVADAAAAMRASADTAEAAAKGKDTLLGDVAAKLRAYAAASRTLAAEIERWPGLRSPNDMNRAAGERDNAVRAATGACYR